MNSLSLEGGGTRGLMQAVILTQLEAQYGKPLWELFDIMGGTSVGSIVAGCLAAGIPASDVIGFFTTYAPKIFSGAWWIPLPRLWSSAKYSSDNLRAALTAVVGTRTLADCKTEFIATAFEMTTGRSAYFQSYGMSRTDGDEIVIGPDSLMPLVDVMMASSAAQSYFPGHKWENYLFWDGGSTGFNAPDMLVLSEAQKVSPAGAMTLKMLSIGNGKTSWPYQGRDMTDPGIATVASATFDIAYSGPENGMVWLAKNLLGSRHYRLDPVIEDYAIDDASGNTLAGLTSAARQCLANNPQAFAAFLGYEI